MHLIHEFPHSFNSFVVPRCIAVARGRAAGIHAYTGSSSSGSGGIGGQAPFFLRILIHRESGDGPSSASSALQPPTSSFPAAGLAGSLESLVGMEVYGKPQDSARLRLHILSSK